MRPVSNKHRFELFFLTAWLTLAVSGCGKENQNKPEGEVPAPGAAYSAVIFHRNADNLRTETENISIVRYGEVVLNDIGNVYSASREDTVAPQKLWINWRTPDTLQIFRDPTTKSYKEEKHFDCLTGIFIQTTPFTIEYGDFRDIHPAASSQKKAPTPPASPKTQKKRRQKYHRTAIAIKSIERSRAYFGRSKKSFRSTHRRRAPMPESESASPIISCNSLVTSL